MTKGELRELLMQSIFQMEAQSDRSIRQAEVLIADKKLKDKERTYILSAVSKIRNNISNIDSKIDKYANTFKSDKMDKVSLAILRVAIFELDFIDSLTTAIIINEAVRISKLYSTEKAGSLVNGILGSYVKETGRI